MGVLTSDPSINTTRRLMSYLDHQELTTLHPNLSYWSSKLLEIVHFFALFWGAVRGKLDKNGPIRPVLHASSMMLMNGTRPKIIRRPNYFSFEGGHHLVRTHLLSPMDGQPYLCMKPMRHIPVHVVMRSITFSSPTMNAKVDDHSPQLTPALVTRLTSLAYG